MIRIRFYKKVDGSVHLTMKGHAGAGPVGEDLVCAAATMLAYTVAQAVQFHDEQEMLTREPKIDIRDGDAVVIATPTKDGYAAVLHTFWVAQCGAHILACNYPRNVRIEQFLEA
jgi:uncharacterized protein YsxB (DUF464 family)